MTNKLDSDIRVCHFVGLSGVGGVQRNFSEYMKLEIISGNEYKHTVYTLGTVDDQYQFSTNILNILELKNLLSLIFDLISKSKIVHFYNNLTSIKVAFFLFFIPVTNLIIHERGSAWNLPSKRGFILKFIAWKSNLIITNSTATKTLVEKKFGISNSKIKVVYNGVNTSIISKKKLLENKETFFIGFLGRLDTPKGIHTLISAMHNLKHENIKLVIAGDGPLRQDLMNRARNLNNVQFIGRVSNPHNFFNTISLLVVPSIREPLGNVCIEAGLYKVPVVASYIDGIPEIIDNYISGELIKPTQPVTDLGVENSIPMPEYVVNPIDHELTQPMQIDPSELADRILFLSKNPCKLSQYANKLHKNIINNFSIENYRKHLNNIYLGILNCNPPKK
ncbi:glycosyltransferase family 4 protein [bacterium]|nr:glycosyltransferase family 4 protein [bacterium]